MFLGLTNTKIIISPFLGGEFTSISTFWRIDRTPTPSPLYSERQPAMINQNHLFHFFFNANKASNNIKHITSNLRICHLLYFEKRLI